MEKWTYKFKLGRTVISPGVVEGVHPWDVLRCLQRHAQSDWKDPGPNDRACIEPAILIGTRLLSVCHDRYRAEFWIITEASGTTTAVILPTEISEPS